MGKQYGSDSDDAGRSPAGSDEKQFANEYAREDGDVRGENVGALPAKGTDRGMPSSGMGTSKADADTSAEATNRRGGFNADSDPAERCHPAKPPKGRA